MYDYIDIFCKKIKEKQFNDLFFLFKNAFENVKKEHLESYLSSTDKVLILYKKKSPVSFIFYEIKNFDNRPLLHYSLSGKIDGVSGCQYLMGKHVYFKKFLKLKNIFKTHIQTTVSNNPRSYLNMLNLGFPTEPNTMKAKPSLSKNYFDIAKFLGFLNIDNRGRLLNRMNSLGFDIKQSQLNYNELENPALGFLDYIEHNTNHGVFIYCYGLPLIDLPIHLIKKFFGWK